MAVDPVSLAITVALNAAVMGMTAMQKIEGPRLQDLSVSTADYGTPLPNIHGASRVECICFYVEKIREEKHKTKTKGGKYTEYKYFGTWASLLADHEINAVLKVWLDRRLAYDRTGTTGGPIAIGSLLGAAFGTDGSVKLGINGNWRIYYGTETQLQDPRMLATIEAKEGPGTCPAYLGVAYMMFEEIPLEKFGNRLPQVSALPMRGLGTDPHPYFSTTLMEDMGGATMTPSRRRLVNQGSHAGVDYIQVWDLVTLSVVVDVRPVAHGIAGYTFGFISETQFYAIRGDGLWLMDIYGGGTLITSDVDGYPSGSPDYQGGVVFTYGITGGDPHFHYLGSGDGGPKLIDQNSGFVVTHFFEDTDGNAWLIGPVQGGSGDIGIQNFTATTPAVIIHTGHDGVCGAIDNGYGQFFVIQQGAPSLLIDKDTLTIVHTSADNSGGGFALPLTMRGAFQSFAPGAPSVWFGYEEWGTQTGELLRTVDPIEWKSATSSFVIYDPNNHALVGNESFTGYNGTWRFLDRLNPDGVTLESICTIVAELAGMELGDFDFTDLDQLVAGYQWTQGAAKDVVGALLDIYDSDIRPHGFIQEGLKRGRPLTGPPIETEWMVPSGDDQPLYSVPMKSETDLPRRVFCTFADSNADDQPNTAIAQRNAASVKTDREASFDLSTMRATADVIQPMVERALRRYWIMATEPTLTVTPLEIKLEPGDVRMLELDNQFLRCVSKRMVIRADRSIQTEWAVDGETPFALVDWEDDDFVSISTTFTSPGGETNGRPPDVILIPQTSDGFVLDIPLLTDADDSSTPFLYVAAAPQGPGFWPGTTVWSSDFGTDDTFDTGFETFTSDQEAVSGFVSAPLSAAVTDVFDEANVLKVFLPNGGTLSSVTEDELLANPTLNLCVLGQEIIQFRDADLIATTPVTYELTGLLRGCRGTEWAVAVHPGGERFLLVGPNVRKHLMGATEIGDTDYYKFSTFGDDLDDLLATAVDFAANANRPLSPAHVELVRNAGTGDWTITWQRRTRIGGSTVDGQDVPLGETSELYRVRIAGTTRTIEVTAQTATYTNAQQVSDWGSGQTSLGVEVVQVSPSLSLEGFATVAVS